MSLQAEVERVQAVMYAAENKLRSLAGVFSGHNFTDRGGDGPICRRHAENVAEARTTIAALAERLAVAEADAARWQQVRKGLSDYHGDIYCMAFGAEGDYPVSDVMADQYADAAIDTARAGEKG